MATGAFRLGPKPPLVTSPMTRPVLVGDLGAFARRRLALGQNADALARRAVDSSSMIRCGAGKILVALAALADGPDADWPPPDRCLVDVMAVEAKPGFQPQPIARAKTDRQHFGLGQQRARDALGIVAFDRNLEAVFAGIAGAAEMARRAASSRARPS